VDGDDQCDFVKFAHGILNQTNSFVADSMSKLREIRKIQMERRNAEAWEALAKNERDLKVSTISTLFRPEELSRPDPTPLPYFSKDSNA